MTVPTQIAPRFYNFGSSIYADRREIGLADALAQAFAWRAKGWTYHYQGDHRFAALCFADSEALEAAARAAERSRLELGYADPCDYDARLARFGEAR